jgi:hypothetical protein
MKDGQQTNYHAYLLRLWRDGDKMPWRATLENPHSGERRGFASLAHLFAYLETHTHSLVESPPNSGDD